MTDAHPLRAQTLSILQELVGHDTVSSHSNLPLIEAIEQRLAPLPCQMERVASADGMKANLIVRFGPEAPGGMVWSGHTDVVPVAGQVWDTPPFTLTEKDGTLYGRGTSDMKSFLACCLALAPQLTSRETPLYFAFSYDEEVGCLGVPSLVRRLIQQGATPEYAIIGEPTMMQVVTAHKGVLSYHTSVRGLEAHSSQPHLGVNAVQVASELVAFLSGMARELAEHGLRDARFTPPYTTVHVGMIQGGTARNIIPRECSFHWEIRPLPNYDGDKLFERFQRKASALRDEICSISDQADIVTRPISRMLGVTLPPEAEHACGRIMHAAERNAQHAVSFGTEAGVFHEHHIPSIICGPGSIEQAHKPNEFITIDQIDRCLTFLERLLMEGRRQG